MTTRLTTFRVGHLDLAIDVAQVRELLRPQELTRVPLAPPEVRGLLNLRGSVVPAIDLRLVLGLTAGANQPMNLIVEEADTTISLWIDEPGEVLEIAGGLQALPATLAPALRELLSGMVVLPYRMLLVLNPTALMARLTSRN